MISDRRIREAAFPIQILLQTLRYVVEWAETADKNFKMQEDDRIQCWINTLEDSRNSALELNPQRKQKMLRSVDILSFDVTREFFANREVIYLIYTMFFVVKNLINSEKWKIPEQSEEKFFTVWAELGPYLEEKHFQMIEGSEKSATKKAGKIIEWLNNRGMY